MIIAAEIVSDRDEERIYSISELAETLGVTPRTLRFYEDKGLLKPQRVAGTRIYKQRDKARLSLILRGKRLGFSLREIGELFDLYDADATQRSQLDRFLALSQKKIKALELQRDAIDQTLDELREIERMALGAMEDPNVRHSFDETLGAYSGSKSSAANVVGEKQNPADALPDGDNSKD